MTWHTITGAGVSIATKFFGDTMNKISNMFNTVDVSDVVKIHTNVTWTFDGNAFRIRDSDDSNSYIFVGGNLASDRNVNLPVLAGNDTIAFLAEPQQFTGNKTFDSTIFRIRNPADTFSYSFTAAAIIADRIVTLPLLTAGDTLVTQAFPQPLTNKTMDGDLNTFIDINETQMNVSVGASGTVLTSTGVGSPPTYQTAAGGAPFVDTTSIVEGSADNTKELRFEVDGFTTGTVRVVTPPNADIIMAGTNFAQSWTAKQTYQDDSIEISNPADTSQYLIQAGAITTDRTLNLPVITASDTLSTLGLAQTVSAVKTHSEDIFFNTQTKGVVNIDTQTKTQKSQYTTDNAGNILVKLIA